MRLYEIDYKIREFWDKVMEQEGELTEEDLQTLESLETSKNEKIKAYGVIIRETTAEIGTYGDEITRIGEIVEKKKKSRERLKNALKDFLINNDIPKFESPEVNISFRKSVTLEVDENAKLPETMLRVEWKPNKTAITEFLKRGGHFDGCRLVEKNNIQIK